MDLNKLDLSRCLYDPRESTLLNDLKAYPEFESDIPYKLPKKKILTYVILIYDMNSPLRKEIRDISVRRLVALSLAGFKQGKDGKFERPIELMLEGKNPVITSMIVKYLVLQNDPRWERLCLYEHMMHKEVARGMMSAYRSPEAMVKATEALSDLKIKLTEELIGGAEEAEPILAAIYKETTKDLDISPEKVSAHIASMRKEKGGASDIPDDWNPYSVWVEDELKERYKVDPIKYAGAE